MPDNETSIPVFLTEKSQPFYRHLILMSSTKEEKVYRDFFTNKWVLGGIAFLIAFGIYCVLWYHYDTARFRQDTAKTAQLLRQVAAKNASSDDKTEPTVANSASTVEKPTESPEGVLQPDTSTEEETKRYKEGDIYVGKTPPSISVPQDQLISPYGFGPYPDMPEGFGPITWPRKNAESELRIRVKIELLKQGIPVEGSVMKDGLVYPIIKGIRYVEWGETSYGRRYLRRSTGHPDDGAYLRTIREEKRKRRENFTQADVPDIQLIPYEEGGIDPYTFLDLSK